MAETMDSTALFQGYKAFYDCHDLSDLTIVCGARKWKVHKLVMSANSSFFRKACTGEFKEAKDNTIELKEDEGHAVAAMIYYLYHGTYAASVSKDGAVSQPVFHLHVYMTGDKYDVNGLSKLAKGLLTCNLPKVWEKGEFADAIETVYKTDMPDSYFRDMIVNITKDHYRELFADGTGFAKFKQVARTTPEFTFEVIQAIGSLSQTVRDSERPMDATTRPLRSIDDLGEDEMSEEEDLVQGMINTLDNRASGYQGRRTQLKARKVALVRRRQTGQGTLQVTPGWFQGTFQSTPVRHSGRRRR